MKKTQFIKRWFTAAVITAMLFCGISCASTGTSPKEAEVNFDTSALIGTWFWNFGNDQGQFANEQITFYKDKTFDLFHVQQEWSEYDKGIYSVINDNKYGPTLVLNLKQGKNKPEDKWDNGDVKIYFAIQSFEDDLLIMSRVKRDFTAMGWIVQYFDPGVYNEFHKVTDGTKENLIGKWNFNKKSRPVGWDESWIFNEDDTIQIFTEEDGNKEDYKGTYAVEKAKTGIVLHQILTHINENDNGFKALNPPMEFWYDYKICNDNIISVNTIKNKIDGKENVYNPNIENFYYRDIPLQTVTYHWDNYTFNDYYPAGTEYETLGMDKIYLFNGIPQRLLEQKLEGWYDNKDFAGEPVTKIAATDANTHEYWAKWSLYLNRSDWIDGEKQEQVHNHEFYMPGNLLFPYMSYPKSMVENFPGKGDTVYVLLSGKMSENFKGWWGLRLVDQSDGWFEIANDWHYAEINKGEFSHLFELKFFENARAQGPDKIEFNLCYNPDHLDEPRTISDFNFIVLEGNSKDIIEHTFNYGGFTYTAKSIKNHEYYLPSPKSFQNVPWQLYNQDFVDWYDNPEFKGNPIKVLSASDNSKPKTFYGKFNLVFGAANSDLYSNTNVFVKSVIPDAKINPKAGDTVKVIVTGTLSKDYEGRVGLDLQNVAGDWIFLGNDWHFVATKDKKFETFFEIKIQKDADFKTIDEAMFILALNPEKEGMVYKLSDVHFEFADKDPFVKTEAQTKHVSVKPCPEGFEVTVRKLDTDIGDWQNQFNFEVNENVKVPGTNVYGRYTNATFDARFINENKTVTFIWPFCEKGKVYNFDYNWTDSKGKWHSENVKVLATTGLGDFNFKPLDDMKITLESNKKEANLIVTNLSVDNILKAVGKHIDMVDSIRIEFPFVSGKNDWSNTNWLFGSSCDVYPTFNENDTFYTELFTKGKSNILGDHNFWYGDKKKINEELSKYPEFWTDFRIHMHVKGNPDYVNNWIQTNRTKEFPYVPAKF